MYYFVDAVVSKDLTTGSVTNIPFHFNGSGFPDAYFSHCRSDGMDVLPKLLDGTTLDKEMVKFDSGSKTQELWIRIPNHLTSVDTTVRLWYGDGTSRSNNTGVWDSAAMVLHCVEATGVNMYDSTGNGNTGVPQNSPVRTTGMIGTCLTLDGVNQGINCGNGSSFQMTAAIRISALVRFDADIAENGGMHIIGKDKISNRTFSSDIFKEFGYIIFRFYTHGGPPEELAKGTTNLSQATVYKLSASKSSSGVLKVFVNGASDGTPITGVPSMTTGTGNITVGYREYTGFENYLNGKVDEVRVESTDRSDAWELADARSCLYPGTYYSISAEQVIIDPSWMLFAA